METPESAKRANIVGSINVPYNVPYKDDKPTFTKSIMTIVMLLYFLGAILGGILVVAAAVVDTKLGLAIDSQMFIAYAAYIGGPTATAIGFYAWKSKAENILKIENSNKLAQKETVTCDASSIASTLANMRGD